MVNLDINLLRRCLLAGSGTDAVDELLRNVRVEELVLQLSSMDDSSFVDDSDDDSSVVPVVDDRYVGTLLVRVLELVLQKSQLGQLFQNPEVLSLLSQRVITACLPVRRLVARKCLIYFRGNDGPNETLEELMWQLLFDSDYRVFESCSKAICTLVKRREGLITTERIAELTKRLQSPDPECVLVVRLFEFCGALGTSSPDALNSMLKAGVFNQLFGIYMSADFLVKMNCLEILESSPQLFMRLQETHAIPHDFIAGAVQLLEAGGELESSDALLVPFIFRMLVSMHGHGLLGQEETRSLLLYVSRTIVAGNPQRDDPVLCHALGCFGRLYLSGSASDEACRAIEKIVSSTTKEDIFSSVLDSLLCIGKANLTPEQLGFLVRITNVTLKALSRFAISEVREQAFTYLGHVIRFQSILELVLEEEARTHLLSSEENLYAATIAKKKLVREVLRMIEITFGNTRGPLTAENAAALRRYAQ